MAGPEVKDIRKEITKYGNVDCGKKYFEELKLKKEAVAQ